MRHSGQGYVVFWASRVGEAVWAEGVLCVLRAFIEFSLPDHPWCVISSG